MDFIADLHVHSPHSRATSRECDLPGLHAWAQVKGIQVVGTGDFTHPGWLARLKELLVPAEPGLFRLRDEEIAPPFPGLRPAAKPTRFLLSAEISSIYKRAGRVRKIHNLLYVPDFAAAGRIAARLAGIGNIASDGRPILGLDSRDLLEILLESAPEGFLVPAHVWTPWFSLFGSRSGFDTVEECFGDLAGEIFALETGLSSDPEMNRRVSALDRFALVSNSDCHSPGKLGREANLFACDLDFFALREALRANDRQRFRGTVEFFPEEGKYHLDGHRKCGVVLEPRETRELGGLCPQCDKPLTVGVQHRVLELADREEPHFAENAPAVHSLVPLAELLGEILGVGAGSKKVAAAYGRLVGRFGSELALLLETPAQELAEVSPVLAEGVARVRRGAVIRSPGFDGEFGRIRVFEAGEVAGLGGQESLFGETPRPRRRGRPRTASLPTPEAEAPAPGPANLARELNPEQLIAVHASGRRVLVTAGPGTGKTAVLVARLAALLRGGEEPGGIWAITFTNRAADEVRERLVRAAGPEGEKVFVGTFHRFALEWLRRREPDLQVAGPESRARLLRRLFPGHGREGRKEIAAMVAAWLQRAGAEDLFPAEGAASAEVRRYLETLDEAGSLDLDGVVPELLRRLQADPAVAAQLRRQVLHLFVDEFQDLNPAQYGLVAHLAASARIFAIGDPDQAIYGFRGSSPEFFHRFAEVRGTDRLTLLRNYRSAVPILAAATAVIAPGRSWRGPTLEACSGAAGRIELHVAPSPPAEGAFVARRIEQLVGGVSHVGLAAGRGGEGGLGFGDIAVLGRTGRQLDATAAELERRGIPFQRSGATPFYLRASLSPLYRLLQAAAGSRETAEWLALAGELPGIGAASLARLDGALPLHGDFLRLARSVKLPAPALAALSSLERNLQEFARRTAREGIPGALGQAAGWLGIDPGSDDLQRLRELAGSFGRDLEALARHLREYASATVYDPRAEAVALLTLHGAKGLEFPAVFLTGLEEGLLPLTDRSGTDLEEERRLCYVGLTRARELAILTRTAERPGTGPRQTSRFLAEIPGGLLTRTDPHTPPTRRPPGRQLDLF